MGRKHAILLTVDGIINLVLGVFLLLFPIGIPEIIGVPRTNLDFYPTILGGVLFGIGIALLIERYGYRAGVRGLGLGGAISINICGALVLSIWLLSASLEISVRGYVILWAIAIIVLGVGIIEAFAKSWTNQ